jgi:outer membrane protein TolC
LSSQPRQWRAPGVDFKHIRAPLRERDGLRPPGTRERQVQKSYYAVEIARASLPALQRALEAARLNYAQADARFKAGLGSGVEVADAETLLAESEIRLAMGRFELARARAIFGRMIAEGAEGL